MNRKRIALAAVSAAAISMGVVALPAAAQDGAPAKERGAKAEKSPRSDAGKKTERAERVRGRRAGRGLRRCTIADDRLLTAADHRGLARLEKRLARRALNGKITPERAERIFDRRAKKVTIKVEMRTARWAPVFRLLDVEGDSFKAQKVALRTARREAGGMRALLESKGKTVADLRAARREGRKAARAARVELCRSGADAPEEKPKADKPAEESGKGSEDAEAAAV